MWNTESPREMQWIILLFVWPTFLRRFILSGLSALYESENSEEHTTARHTLTPAQKVELNVMIDLLPLLRSNIRLKFSRRLYDSDDNKSGGGVAYCYSTRTEDHLKALDGLLETRDRKGWKLSLVHQKRSSEISSGTLRGHPLRCRRHSKTRLKI